MIYSKTLEVKLKAVSLQLNNNRKKYVIIYANKNLNMIKQELSNNKTEILCNILENSIFL
jgi:hypothetical protein